MNDLELFRILRERRYEPTTLEPLLAQLSRRSLRDRTGYFGLLIELCDLETTPPTTRRMALACLEGATGIIALEAAVNALDGDVERTAALAILARASASQRARWAHAVFHDDPEVRLAACAQTTPEEARHLFVFLLADPHTRDAVLARLESAPPKIPGRLIGTIIDLFRAGCCPADLARRLSHGSTVAVTNWATHTRGRDDARVQRILADAACGALEAPAAYGEDPLDGLVELLVSHPLELSEWDYFLAHATAIRDRFVASLLLGTVASASRPWRLALAVCLWPEVSRFALYDRAERFAALELSFAWRRVTCFRIGTADAQALADALREEGATLNQVAGVLVRSHCYLPNYVEARGVETVARELAKDPEHGRWLFSLPDAEHKVRLALLSRMSDEEAIAVLTVFAADPVSAELSFLEQHPSFGRVILEASDLDTEPSRVRILTSMASTRFGIGVFEVLVAPLLMKESTLRRTRFVRTMLERLAVILDATAFSEALASLSTEVLEAFVALDLTGSLLPFSKELALALALLDHPNPALAAWAAPRAPRTSPSADVSTSTSTRALAGAAYRPLGHPDVAACVELLGSVDPIAATDAAFLTEGSADPRFVSELEECLVEAYAYGEPALSPLGHAFLWRWDFHATTFLEALLATFGALAPAIESCLALESTVLRSATMEALSAAFALLRFRDRARLRSLIDERVIDAILTALSRDAAAGAASALAHLAESREIELRDAHRRVRVMLPSLSNDVRERLERFVDSAELPLRPPPRVSLPADQASLALVRSLLDPSRVEPFLTDERLALVHEATLRLIELGERGLVVLADHIERSTTAHAILPILESVSLWPDGDALARCKSFASLATSPADIRFRLAHALFDRGLEDFGPVALDAARTGTATSWFTETDWVLLSKFGVTDERRALSLAISPQAVAYVRAVEELLAASPTPPVTEALFDFLSCGAERMGSLRRRVARQLFTLGDSRVLPLVIGAMLDDAPKDAPMLAGVADDLVLVVTRSFLAAGNDLAKESILLQHLRARGLSAMALEQAYNLILEKAAKDRSRIEAARVLSRGELRERKLRRVAQVFSWGGRVARRMLGRPMRIRMTGTPKLGYTRLRESSIFVTPLPILRGDRHGDELVEGLVLHELGHHLYHAGQLNEVWWKAAEDRGLRGLLNLVADEHLERNLRAVDSSYGDRLKRLAAYAFQHTGRELKLEQLLSYLGRHAVRILATVSLSISRDPESVVVRSGRLLYGMEQDGLAFSRFVRALRMGLGNRHEDPKVKEALALFGSEFKHYAMERLWTVTQRLREIFGAETDIAESLGGHEELDDPGEASVFRSDIWADDVDREIDRITSPEDRQKGEGDPNGRLWINVADVPTFTRITRVEKVAFDAEKHAPYARAVARPAEEMRRFFEELGVSRRPSRMRLSGRHLDTTRLRALVLRGDPRVLQNSERVVRTDLFIGIVVDCSGSMASRNNMERAKHFAVLLAEAARPLKREIDLRVFGFTDKAIYDCGDASRCSAHGLSPTDGNNDSAALFHVASVAKASRRRAKLLVMISDGLPTECSVASLRALVKRLSSAEGMVVAQVAVQPLTEICFPHYVVVSEDAIDTTVKKFGRIIAGLVQRAVGSA